jgi:hypothetical protein
VVTVNGQLRHYVMTETLAFSPSRLFIIDPRALWTGSRSSTLRY